MKHTCSKTFRSNCSFDCGSSIGDNSHGNNDTADGRFTSRSAFECCFGVFLDCASIDSAFCVGVSIITVFLEDDFLRGILLLSPFFLSGFSFRSNNSFDGGIVNGSGMDANSNTGEFVSFWSSSFGDGKSFGGRNDSEGGVMLITILPIEPFIWRLGWHRLIWPWQ